MFKNAVKTLAIATTMIASTSLAYAGNDLEFDLSVGQMTGMAQELVFNPDGTMLSKLDWTMNSATVLNANAIIPIGKKFSFSIAATTGINGNNYMEDFDWIGVPSTGAPNLHSWHDNTHLDHYYSLDIAGRFKLNSTENTNFSLLGGFHYVDVKFSSYGGCFVYPTSSGCWADGDPAISYAQNLPAAYGGLSFSHKGNSFSVAAEVKGGVSFNAFDTDYHWMRNLQFIDHGSLAPFVAAKAQVGFALGENINAFVEADFQKYFEQRGETDLYDIPTGAYLGTITGDAAGLSWSSVAISTGVKFHF